MTESNQFDVFLAHNSDDKPQVRIICRKLKEEGLRPWLDEEQIEAGKVFQDEIQQGIIQSKSAAIFIGAKGLGDFQGIELKILISISQKKRISVIPVLLPGVDIIPEGLLLLQQFHWVKFKNINDESALYKLKMGILGSSDINKQTAKIQEYPKQPENDMFQFKNRDILVQELTSQKCPPYRLITAPEGYGKTELLMHVMKCLQKLQWRCAYASISEHENIEDLEKNLAISFGFSMKEGQKLSFGESLGTLLHSNWNTWQSPPQKGIVLLIDINRCTPSKQRFNEIFNEIDKFKLKINECLKQLQFFHNTEKSFRVVIASRCLIDLPLYNKDPKPLILSPFDWQVIQETVTEYLQPRGMTTESIDLLAGHLLYLTGGHPRGIAESLKAYRNGDYIVNSFLENYGVQLWERTLKYCRNQIRESLVKENNDLYKSIEKLSIFPILNSTWILKEATRRFGKFDFPFTDHFKLNTELAKTSIFTRDKTVIKDGMTRRLLAIGLLKESSPEKFQEICREAAQICWDYIDYLKSQNNSAVAGTWAMQYLFQCLQQHAGFINFDDHSLSYRQTISKNFFDNTVKAVIDIFCSKDQDKIHAHDFLCTLKSEIEDDWEFQFVVNYYLRGEQYNDSPYTSLIRQIDEAIILTNTGDNYV
jgi:hypothetical protein